MLLIAFLGVGGAISIYEFSILSNSVHELIDDNYNTIDATKIMFENLEREDSGILLLLLGESEAGRKIISSADSSFIIALNITIKNLTEREEEQYIKSIEETYLAYKNKWNSPIVETDKQGNISWYKNDIHQPFLNAKKAVSDLMNLNQTSIYNRATELKEKSKRAIMPAIVAIISALVFSIILNFFITKYFVKPISDLAVAVNKHREGDRKLYCNITSDDEIKNLEEAINRLLIKLSKTHDNFVK